MALIKCRILSARKRAAKAVLKEAFQRFRVSATF